MSTSINDAKVAASRLFKTPDGKVLMEYLRRRYYDNPMTETNIERLVGRRDVLWDLINLVERDDYGTKR